MQQEETLPVLSLNQNDSVEIRLLRESESYDGHSLRAYNYWKHEMDDIRQVPDGTQCYEINGQLFTDRCLIKYNGRVYNAKEIYEEFEDVRQ